MRKMYSLVYLSILLTELWSLKCQKWLVIFVYSADERKKSATVWAKYIRISERSYLPLSENALNYWVLTQPAVSCPKLTIETLEQGVKYVQS